jgi:hypothetical protein
MIASKYALFSTFTGGEENVCLETRESESSFRASGVLQAAEVF